VERLTVGFGDLDGGLHGVAISGAGLALALDGLVRTGPPPLIGVRSEGAWTLGGEDGVELEVELTAMSLPAALGPRRAAVPCRARGTIAGTPLDGLGTVVIERAPAPRPIERALAAWLDPQLSLVLAADRPPGARGHGDEELVATIFRGDPLASTAVGDPRLSTTYDGEGRPVHCGIELWETEESEYAVRAGGEAVGGAELAHHDGARTQITFLACHGDGGRHGSGVYLLTERRPA
jgi:hypothetical protein